MQPAAEHAAPEQLGWFQLPVCSEFSEWRIRSAPSLEAKEVGFVESGQRFEVLERSADWLRTRAGWMLAAEGGRTFLQPVVGEHNSVQLEALLEHDAEALSTFDAALVQRGWCLLQMTDYVSSAAAQVVCSNA
eukprot:SAG31_NODE_335_length_17509_cov_7.127972_17_plen_133_part_00